MQCRLSLLQKAAHSRICLKTYRDFVSLTCLGARARPAEQLRSNGPVGLISANAGVLSDGLEFLEGDAGTQHLGDSKRPIDRNHR